jgi:hypothetical protein
MVLSGLSYTKFFIKYIFFKHKSFFNDYIFSVPDGRNDIWFFFPDGTLKKYFRVVSLSIFPFVSYNGKIGVCRRDH